MKREIIALYVFVISVFILMFLIFLAFQKPAQSITGKVINSLIQDSEATLSCTDSDDGRNYNNKGIVEYCNKNGCFSEEDSCSGKTLTEIYCTDNEKEYEYYECEDECDGGLCTIAVTNYRYISSGGGGGGGGGGGSATSSPATAETGQTYSLGDLSEQQIEVYKYDIIQFSLGAAEYTLTIKDNTPTDVILTNSRQTFTLIVGEEQGLDLDSDTIFDMSIKVKSISLIDGKIKLILKST